MTPSAKDASCRNIGGSSGDVMVDPDRPLTAPTHLPTHPRTRTRMRTQQLYAELYVVRGVPHGGIPLIIPPALHGVSTPVGPRWHERFGSAPC